MYRCTREFTGRKKDRQNITRLERAIPSKKMGCRCTLTIKMYPHTDKILGKYDEEHDCYDPGSDFSACLLTGYDYGTPQVSSHISHGQQPQSAE